MQVSKIPAELEKEILTRAGRGESSRAIAEWLGDAHGIRISSQAVFKRLSKTREERAEVAKVIVRETLAPHLTADLDVLAVQQQRLVEGATRLYELAVSGSAGTLRQDAWELFLKSDASLARNVETRLKFAGAGEGSARDDGVQLPSDPRDRAAVLRAMAEREERE